MQYAKIPFVFCFILLTQLCHAIETNKDYYIFHSCGLVMSAADAAPNLHTFQSAEDQVFQFVRNGNNFLIKNKKNGKQVTKSGTWDTEYTSSTSQTALFSIEEVGGDFIKIKCADNNLYLGTDNTAPGSSIYSDKSGNEVLHYWFVRDASGRTTITDGLEAAITKAENALANTIEGDEEGRFSPQNRTILREAIHNAQNLMEGDSGQKEIDQATAQLQTAINTYKNSRNQAFVEGEKYYIVHAGNRLLSYGDNKIQLKEPAKSPNQQFVIEKLNDGSFALKHVQTGMYLSASGEYNTTLAGNTNSNTSHLKINYAPNEESFVRIQFSSNNLYLGTDGTTDGSGVYSDKNGNDGKHYWQLIRVGHEQQQPYSSFRNGSSATRLGVNWLDEQGNHINAHGGCVLFKDGTYYWFGENYRKAPVKSNGIVCYTSKDLYNWKYEYMAYECPNTPLRNDNQDMNFGRTLERPKVMYNPHTGQYVMWVHWENGSGYAASRVAILYSDKITGPYTFLKTMRPRGDEQPSGSRDQTLLYDPEYGVGYHFGSAEENMTMHATLLKDDYLDLSNNWSRIFIQKQYEAPAVIKYHGRFIAITSGCTGWDPNAAHASFSEKPFEGWVDLGNPCVDANANKTYNSQSNFIFEVPNLYNAYIYMGDRWKGGDYFSDANVGESWHIWLPIDMRTGYPILRFYSEWDLSIFEKLNRYRRVKEFEEGKEYLLLSRNANRILSCQEEKFLLTEDNNQKNIVFRLHGGNQGYCMINAENGKALCIENNQLAWNDSTGALNQLWNITKAGNDGYYYFSPKENERIRLTNLCATVTENGIAGMGNTNASLSSQFAFCFDSEKHDYQPITDESDGSYQKWMRQLGYKEVTSTQTTPSERSTGTRENLSIGVDKGAIEIKCEREEKILIHDMNGHLIKEVNTSKGEVIRIQLPSGIYLVNTTKVLVP